MTNIADIRRLRPGDSRNATFVDESGFECYIRDAEEGRGGKSRWWKGKVEDPHNSREWMELTAETDITRYNNRLVRISGRGIRRAEYKGADQIKIGDRTTIEELGSAPPQSQTTYSGTGSAANAAGSDAPRGAGSIAGNRIGNAITNAVHAVVERLPDLKPGTYEWATTVSKVASDLLRIGGFFESGQLIKPASEREKKAEPPKQDPPPRQDPPPPKEIDEEDVPF